jgi:hypothetical protein
LEDADTGWQEGGERVERKDWDDVKRMRGKIEKVQWIGREVQQSRSPRRKAREMVVVLYCTLSWSWFVCLSCKWWVVVTAVVVVEVWYLAMVVVVL